MIGWIILGASIVGLEVINYIYYKKTVDYAEQKTLIKHSSANTTWLKNNWLNELSSEEIILWILNTIHIGKLSSSKIIVKPKLEDISSRKMLKWITYHMYFKPYKILTQEQINSAKLMLELIEEKIDYKFQDIENDDHIQFIKFGSTEIETSYKPVVVYCAMSTIKNLAYMYLKYLGFTKHIMNKTGIVYFYYTNPQNNGKTTIFIHGLGFGVTPYINFVKSLMEYTDIIIPILPNISNMEFHSLLNSWEDKYMFPDYEDLRTDFFNILNERDLYNVNLVGHSFGTIVMSIVLKNSKFKKRINTKIFVDPVCFMDDCYKIFNYIKQPDPRNGELSTSIFNSMIYDDIYVRYTTQRYLYGPEYWLIDYNVLEKNAIVVLSSHDKIVPSMKLHKKLSENNITCIYVNEAEHADIFNMSQYSTVVSTIVDHVNYNNILN